MAIRKRTKSGNRKVDEAAQFRGHAAIRRMEETEGPGGDGKVGKHLDEPACGQLFTYQLAGLQENETELLP